MSSEQQPPAPQPGDDRWNGPPPETRQPSAPVRPSSARAESSRADAPDLQLSDLPAEIAQELEFEDAAPRRLRSSRLPPEARRAFALIWNDLVADIYDELKGSSRTAIFQPSTVTRVLTRVAGQIDEANRLLIVTAVHQPAPGTANWHFIGSAAAGSGVGAGLNELVTYSSAGAGAAAALASAVATELLETYVAASGRVLLYRTEGRTPSPEQIAADIAEALGHDNRLRTHANRETGEAALRWINRRLAQRLSRRFLRSLVPVVGIAVAAQASARDVKRVLDVPLRPPTPSEFRRAQSFDDPFEAAELDYRAFLEDRPERGRDERVPGAQAETLGPASLTSRREGTRPGRKTDRRRRSRGGVRNPAAAERDRTHLVRWVLRSRLRWLSIVGDLALRTP